MTGVDRERSPAAAITRVTGRCRDTAKRLQIPAVIVTYCAVAAGIGYLMSLATGGAEVWCTYDAQRFHAMAGAILEGLTPYIDYVDPKPPLLFFTVALMDAVAPAGSIDIPVVSAANLAAAVLIWQIGREDYGMIAGFSAGLLYLVSAAFVQGYFLFSEQFAVLLLLGAFFAARRSRFAAAGLMLGLAFGFKQYAALAALPLLYMMHAEGERRYYLLIGPAALVTAASFLAVLIAYGNEAAAEALYWTFGVAPAYLQGDPAAAVPAYRGSSVVALAANLVASIVMVLPTLLFAAASVLRRGLLTVEERAIGLFVLVFLATIVVRQYLHYWILMLPFLALLACREFADEKQER
ncbi:hypothetical protein ASZ90_011344 [hydrocarbon metagenome]|uniref:Glycosyltransferase RgtA/B/C/D-like domain-containing protein n=1 Tax=hydrocarbon metagenome TaxID=938273 RepID=A0A0W8FDJ9_9ZZZZ